MRSGLFSPSLELRTEPPYSLGTVLAVTKDPKGRVRYASVQFKGRAIRCRSLHINLAVGEQVAVIEVPRGTFWTRRTGPSWYVKPLSDWTKAGRPAQVAMEYFLKDCRKFWPFVALPKDPEDETDPEDTLALWEKKKSKDGTDGRPKQRVGQEDFYERDTDSNGVITRDEWRTTDGDFDDVDDDGDGEITVEEWKKWKDANTGLGDLPSVWISVSPNHILSPGPVTVTWGSSGETTVNITGTNGEAWSGTSGSVAASIPKNTLFTISGGSGETEYAICTVGAINPSDGWIIWGSHYKFHVVPNPPSSEAYYQKNDDNSTITIGNGSLASWSVLPLSSGSTTTFNEFGLPVTVPNESAALQSMQDMGLFDLQKWFLFRQRGATTWKRTGFGLTVKTESIPPEQGISGTWAIGTTSPEIFTP